jgi:hypothetical protein
LRYDPDSGLDTADSLSDEDRETIVEIARQSLVRFQPKPESEAGTESPTEAKPKPQAALEEKT